jgi:AAA15 family ATPase/GTPase
VDEIENGLHHSIMTKVWAAIFEMARKLNVQVFATTHSWNCIESFQEAANRDPDDGVLVRLSIKEDVVIPTLFREKELEIAARDQIELR